MEEEQLGQSPELDAFLRFLLAELFGLVFVVARQVFLERVVFERLVDVLEAFDRQLDVVEGFFSFGQVVYPRALYVVDEFSAEEVFDEVGFVRGVYFFLDDVEEDAAELLDVLLGEDVSGLPAEGAGEVGGLDVSLGGEHVEEETLEAVDGSVVRGFCFGREGSGHLHDLSDEHLDVEECLEVTIHIASHTHVHQARVLSRRLFVQVGHVERDVQRGHGVFERDGRLVEAQAAHFPVDLGLRRLHGCALGCLRVEADSDADSLAWVSSAHL